MSARLAAYAAFFEALEPDALAQLEAWFSADARFRDPFNTVRGPAAIRRVFEHMFAQCEQPRFQVDEQIAAGEIGYLRWRMAFGPAAARREIEGVSRVCFDAEGRVCEHLDYWDPAAQLYEQLPLVGPVCRLLRRRLAAPQPPAESGRHRTTERTQR